MSCLNCGENVLNTLSTVTNIDCTSINLQSDLLNDLNNDVITSLSVTHKRNMGNEVSTLITKLDLTTDSVCLTCDDVISYNIPISNHGVYNIKLEGVYDDCSSNIQEEVCYFAACDLYCEVAKALINNPNSTLSFKYRVLELSKSCNIDCDKIIELYEELVTELTEINTEIGTSENCTTC